MGLKRSYSYNNSQSQSSNASVSKTFRKSRPQKASRSAMRGQSVIYPSVSNIKNIARKIQTHREVKQYQKTSNVQTLTTYFNAASFQGSNVIPLGPSSLAGSQMAQGVGNSERIGNRIRPVKVMLKLVLSPAPYDVTVNPIPAPYDVRMFIAHSKQTNSALAVDSKWFEANNLTIAPQDNMTDQLLNVNKDIYVVNRDMILKVGPASAEGLGNSATYQYQSNNDYKLNQVLQLDITDCFPKNIVFNDASTLPTSIVPYMIFLLSRADGQSSAAFITPVVLSYTCTWRYTDA